MSQMVKGSLLHVARESNRSLADSFMDVDAVIVVDVSSSMEIPDATGRRTRFDVASNELARLQNQLPGKLAVVSFSNHPQFDPSGKPDCRGGMTDMAAALRFIRPVDGCGVRLILISDGEPDDASDALKVAKKFKTKLDTIYIGPEDGAGRDFLRQLSEATGGASVTNEAAKLNLLSQNVRMLLEA